MIIISYGAGTLLGELTMFGLFQANPFSLLRPLPLLPTPPSL